MPRRLLLDGGLIGLAALLLALALTIGGPTRLDSGFYDALIGYRAPPPSERIFIVTIDDASLAALGRWPWPRSVHASAVEQLGRAGVAAVAYDVLFTEPAREPADDEALARALTKARVALPVLFDVPGHDGRDFDVTEPITPLKQAAAALGHVALPHDPDGISRFVMLQVPDRDGRTWFHLIEQAYRLATGAPSPVDSRLGVGDRHPRLLLPYQPSGAFRSAPFKDLVAGSIPEDALRGRIILIGATAAGLGDRHPLAGVGALPGVEAQASLLNAMLGGGFVTEASPLSRIAFAALPSLVLLLLFWRLRPARALAISILSLALVLAFSAGLLLWGGVWLPPVPALAALLLVYPLWGWRRLSAIDRAVRGELARLEGDLPTGAAPSAVHSDPPGRNAALLSESIAGLRNLKQLIADTVDGVADPMIVTSLSGEVLLANRQARALLDGGNLDERDLGRLGPDEVELADGGIYSPRRTALTTADGTVRGSILLLADITSLRTAVRARDEALEFLSHDMRSPQAAIISLLDGEAKRSVPPPIATRIAGHARRTLKLADDFVHLARARTARFEPLDTDLCAAVAEALDAVWPAASARQVRLDASGQDEPIYVNGEHDALTRALLNILDNAVKFAPQAGTVECRVSLSADDAGSWVDVSIADTGPGVPEERLSRLFERFAPLSQGHGLSAGLGLSYARIVAERHGGGLSHQAVHPHGARFTLRLPMLDQAMLDQG